MTGRPICSRSIRGLIGSFAPNLERPANRILAPFSVSGLCSPLGEPPAARVPRIAHDLHEIPISPYPSAILRRAYPRPCDQPGTLRRLVRGPRPFYGVAPIVAEIVGVPQNGALEYDDRRILPKDGVSDRSVLILRDVLDYESPPPPARRMNADACRTSPWPSV